MGTILKLVELIDEWDCDEFLICIDSVLFWMMEMHVYFFSFFF